LNLWPAVTLIFWADGNFQKVWALGKVIVLIPWEFKIRLRGLQLLVFYPEPFIKDLELFFTTAQLKIFP